MPGLHPRSARRLVFIAGLAAIASVLAAFEWPVGPVQPAALFGSAGGGSFVTGIELASAGGLVKAADSGELAFAWDNGTQAASRLPSTIGSYVIVEHPRGMAGVYAELEPGSASSYLTKVSKDSILGKAGASGMTGDTGLFFGIYDRGARRWVNPFLLLPPWADKATPQIRGAILLRDGKSWSLGDVKSVPQGQYLVAVDVSDPLDAAHSAGPSVPYFVRLVVNGVKAAERSFDVVSCDAGRQYVGSDSPWSFEDSFLPDGKMLMGSRLLSRGKAVIQVLVRDYSGNERQASWTVIVE